MHAAAPGVPVAPQPNPKDPAVPAAVATLLIEPRSRDAIRSTLAMAEVLAGYVGGHYSRAALRKSITASFSLDLATRLLIASVNNAMANFEGRTMQLCNDLGQAVLAVDRVAPGLGIRRRG